MSSRSTRAGVGTWSAALVLARRGRTGGGDAGPAADPGRGPGEAPDPGRPSSLRRGKFETLDPASSRAPRREHIAGRPTERDRCADLLRAVLGPVAAGHAPA